MNAKHKILPAVCCIALMTSCASNQSTSAVPWTIKSTAVTRSSGDKPEAMYQLGRYYQGQNRFDEAINAYMKALNADAGFVEARNGLGVVYSRQGKYREAIEAFRLAIKQAPKAAHLYSNMGYAYYLQGQYAESVKALQQATALDPNNQRALNNLGQAYAKAGNTTQAALAFSEAISVEKTTQQAAEAAVPVPAPSAPPSVTYIAAAATPAPAADSSAVSTAAAPQDVQVLAIPKDRGVIRTADTAPLVVPAIESRAKLVQLAPHVSELQISPQSAETVQVAAVEAEQNMQQIRLEVANGNGVNGAAGKVSRFLREQGYMATRLTNKKPYRTLTTQIHYRPGYEAQALLLQSKLLDAPKLVERRDIRANVNVRVVLGRDMVTQLAHYESRTKATQLALHASEGNTGAVQQLF
ncbi:LytR C-terminal domain-containing protein [Methylotenera sp. G11]|uniref:LytR C-terminal domain-containing protein n=1 Tax=Methylotenera sp. G11 TaxID=1506585 RepID=UPI0009DCEC2A|nr:LytR C-terminal domain-containing protein [Methylotenera sp. G11]